MLQEIHGLRNISKLDLPLDDKQHTSVLVADSDDKVRLAVPNVAAGLTPEEARYIAKCLIECAERIEKRAAGSTQP